MLGLVTRRPSIFLSNLLASERSLFFSELRRQQGRSILKLEVCCVPERKGGVES